MKQWCIAILAGEIFVIGLVFLIESSGVVMPTYTGTVFMCGYALTLINVVKYVPQFYLNYKRKSTVGLSTKYVVLDMVGSVFSLMQLGMDTMHYGRYVVGTKAFNISKFSLAITALFFDLLFIM